MLSDEEKKAIKVVNKRTERLIEELKIEEEDLIDEPKIAYLITQIAANKTLVNLIEKQSKEIEELKENNKNLEDELNKYIVQLTDEQYRKLVDIIRDKTSKEWNDKIKAKIEEWQKEKEFYDKDEDREWGQYNNWDWVDTIINEMQSLLEKE